MNKEQQELLDDAYFKRYRLEAWGECDRSWLLELDGINLTTGEKGKVHRQLTQEEFIDRCKTNPEFSGKWGLQIEEIELSFNERYSLIKEKTNENPLKYSDENGDYPEHIQKPVLKWMEMENIPTKLITVKYNDKTIENYE